jgi:hypothetical protein
LGRQVVISDGVYEMVKTFVFETCGTFHKGSIKETVENALRYYLHIKNQQRQNTHTPTHRDFDITNESNVPKKLIKYRNQIVDFLEENHYGFEADLLKRLKPQTTATCVYVTLQHLKIAIAYVVGDDKRTLQNYLNKLKNYNLVRVVDVDKFEFAPFIDGKNIRTYSNDIDDDEFKVDVEGIQRRQREREEKAQHEYKEKARVMAAAGGLEQIDSN